MIGQQQQYIAGLKAYHRKSAIAFLCNGVHLGLHGCVSKEDEVSKHLMTAFYISASAQEHNCTTNTRLRSETTQILNFSAALNQVCAHIIPK